MQVANLAMLLRGDEILLAMKKRRFGEGKWNGVGGKVMEGESIEESLVREIKEEIGVSVKKEDCEKVAILNFYFTIKPEWDQVVHVYTVRKWEGEPAESEEMKPQWYKLDEIPYDKMWQDDKDWLPLVLKNKKAAGEFRFSDLGQTFESVKLTEVPGF